MVAPQVIDLCGSELCTNEAACSYLLHGRRVQLCLACLRGVASQTMVDVLSLIGRLLPGFEWKCTGVEAPTLKQLLAVWEKKDQCQACGYPRAEAPGATCHAPSLHAVVGDGRTL
jgi:hypothetical protein